MQKSDVPMPWSEEYERIITGLTFRAGNSQLMLNHKLYIRQALSEFNDTSILPSDTLESLRARRIAVAKRVLGKLGPGANIEAPFFCTFGCQILVGKGCYIDRNVQVFDSALVALGERVLGGPGAMICTGMYELDVEERRAKGGNLAGPVEIRDDVWIGVNAIVLPDIKIGSGSTIAAGAVATKPVPENTLVGGVPDKAHKKLGGPEKTEPVTAEKDDE